MRQMERRRVGERGEGTDSRWRKPRLPFAILRYDDINLKMDNAIV